jgi:hypothetical protein
MVDFLLGIFLVSPGGKNKVGPKNVMAPGAYRARLAIAKLAQVAGSKHSPARAWAGGTFFQFWREIGVGFTL